MTTTSTHAVSAATSTGAPIKINSITKAYGDNTVLDSVDLEVHAGEFLTLLGASGSGKSTLLNTIAGFIEPSAGRIEVDGRDITSLPPHRRGLGVVFQHYALFPHMSVAENVAYPLKRQKVAKDEIRRRVAETLEIVELGHLGGRQPSELSGGQQQRVALARAIVFQPRVLLMDEPLGALDKMLREQLQLEIRRLHKEMGITVVFVTHDQEEALTMSDRIALLRHGQIVQVGTPEELYDQPNCRYSAEFIGMSNMFTGSVNSHGFQDSVNNVTFPLATGASADGGTMMIRPERVGIAADLARVGGTEPRVEGTVVDCIYLGSHRTVQVRTDQGQMITARTEVPRSPDGVEPGERVVAHWHPADAAVLK